MATILRADIPISIDHYLILDCGHWTISRDAYHAGDGYPCSRPDCIGNPERHADWLRGVHQVPERFRPQDAV